VKKVPINMQGLLEEQMS